MNTLSNYENQGFAELFKSFRLFGNTKNIKNTKNKNIMEVIKNLMTALLIGFVTIANANNNPIESPTANLTETANEKIRLTLVNNERTILRIQDVNGLTIYNEAINGENIVAKNYDLTSLADGIYVFSIELSDKIVEQTVSVEEGNIALGNSTTSSKPVFVKDEKALFVTVDDLSNDAVEVRILNNDGVEVYKNEKQNINQFNTKYDMSKLLSNNYTVIVTVAGKSYYQYMELN